MKSPEGLVLVRDVKLEGGRQRHPSGGVSAKEMVIGLEGVELGADGKVRGRHLASRAEREPKCLNITHRAKKSKE